ncbi:MAG: DNA glycosylase AlkZ-like family protein [Candidatus Dormibacteria bacterium]
MDETQRLRAWTHHRQRLGGNPASGPLEALRSVVAVYGAHPTAPLALAARTAGMTAGDFRALDQERSALRIPGMRGSLFLVPSDTAGRVFAPFQASAARVLTRMRRAELDDEGYRAASERIVATASLPLLPRELEDVAGVSGVRMSLLLRTIRAEGRMLAVAQGSLRAAQLRYVATASWAAGALEVDDVDAALAALAGDYLRGYGPARPADFAWWTGVGTAAAARALATVDTVDVGNGLLLPRNDEPAFSGITAPRNTVDLLPKWDAYTMGFAPDGRARLVHLHNQPQMYVRQGVMAPGQPNVGLSGDGYPVVLVDGEAVGTWNVTVREATVHLFDTVGPATRRRIDERLADVRSLLAD